MCIHLTSTRWHDLARNWLAAVWPRAVLWHRARKEVLHCELFPDCSSGPPVSITPKVLWCGASQEWTLTDYVLFWPTRPNSKEATIILVSTYKFTCIALVFLVCLVFVFNRSIYSRRNQPKPLNIHPVLLSILHLGLHTWQPSATLKINWNMCVMLSCLYYQ